MRGDGNGWVVCGQGHEHWGRYGAAGLLLAAEADGGLRVLLQHRAAWSHNGGTWGLVGGARDSHEDGVTAALREAAEEARLDPADVGVRTVRRDDHGGWAYETVLARAARPLPVVPDAESLELRWVPVTEVTRLPLHPGLAASWPALAALLDDAPDP